MSHPYRPSEASAAHLAAASGIASTVIAQHAADVDARARFAHESIDALAKAGLLGLTLPASHGGKGEGMRTFTAVTK